ncbi:MAG TPA: hypothetical protein VFW83_00140, partial [Bryobacteraceae bacterium]|nr:hypothetical protein [Bryobacteraceae bacterium]
YIAAAVLLEKLLSRLEVHRSLRFSLIFLLPLAALVCGNYWFRTELLAQPWRFHIAMEMALMLCVAAILPHFSLPRIPVRVLQAAFILFCCVQAVHYRSYARRLIRRIDVSKTSEYKMSRWIAQNLPGERVMVPGSVSFWLNVFADTPQLTGCCSQGLIDREVRYGQYQIENDIGAKGREFPITLVWLQALGVRAIGVSGPRSTEWYKAIQHPGKFVGKLPELWRDGDDVVYRVPQRSASLVHVLRRDQAVSRAPVNGIDIDPLLPYVAALEDPAYPQAEITWKSDNLAQIQAPLDSGELLSIQIAADPGWRAVSNGKPLRIEKDGLGFMMVDPQCTGLCTVDLIYNGGLEASITGFVSSLALVFGLVVLVFKVRISLIKSAE